MPRFLIIDADLGVYLGACLGLGFWSKLDPAGQDAAITFSSEAEAQRVMSKWESSPAAPRIVPVTADLGDFASIAACCAAGAPAWTAE